MTWFESIDRTLIKIEKTLEEIKNTLIEKESGVRGKENWKKFLKGKEKK